MFTIRQANGVYKQTNSIDELIKEYIKQLIGSGGLGDISDQYALKTDIPDHTIYALKTDIPNLVDLSEYYTKDQAKEQFVEEDELAYELQKYVLTTQLTDYALKTDIPIPIDLTPYALKTDIPKINDDDYLKNTGDATINGTLTITNNNTSSQYITYALNLFRPSIKMLEEILIRIGKGNVFDYCATIGYHDPGKGFLSIYGQGTNVIEWTYSSIKLNRKTTITSDVIVEGTVTSTNITALENKLQKYALKKDYRKIDDLTIKEYKYLDVSYEDIGDCTAKIPYTIGAEFKGEFIINNNRFSFEFTFIDPTEDGVVFKIDNDLCDVNATWNSDDDLLVFSIYGDTYNKESVNIEYVRVLVVVDEIALKSDCITTEQLTPYALKTDIPTDYVRGPDTILKYSDLFNEDGELKETAQEKATSDDYILSSFASLNMMNKSCDSAIEYINNYKKYVKETLEESYALKTDIPVPVDLTPYALKTDIPVIKYENQRIELEITENNTSIQYTDEQLTYIIANGIHIEAKYINDNISGYYVYDQEMSDKYHTVALKNVDNENYYIEFKSILGTQTGFYPSGHYGTPTTCNITSAYTYSDIEYTNTNVPSMNYIKTIETKLNDYALKTDIPDPVDLTPYALKTDIPNDYVPTTELNNYNTTEYNNSVYGYDLKTTDSCNDILATVSPFVPGTHFKLLVVWYWPETNRRVIEYYDFVYNSTKTKYSFYVDGKKIDIYWINRSDYPFQLLKDERYGSSNNIYYIGFITARVEGTEINLNKYSTKTDLTKTIMKNIDIQHIDDGKYLSESFYVSEDIDNTEVILTVKDNHYYNTSFIFINDSSDENIKTCTISEKYVMKLTKEGDKWLVNVVSATEPETKFTFALHTITRKEYAELALKTDLEQYQLKSNTTITHYCPIEGNIDDFVVGAPVYLTGKVYKYDKEFVPSTSNDTTDCICSVKTNGSWKEYVGICTSIDKNNSCLTFASGGDYMVKVNDSSCYAIGDEVFIDNEDNKLKILAGATAITSKIRRMTVGVVTGIIDKNILAVFK